MPSSFIGLARTTGPACKPRAGAVDLVGVETSAESNTYAWERINETPSFEHITIYPDGDIRDLAARHIADRVSSVLSEAQPDVVAVHGWGLPDALAATTWCLRTGTPAVIMSDSTAEDFSRIWWRETVKQRIVPDASSWLRWRPTARSLPRCFRHAGRTASRPDTMWLIISILPVAHVKPVRNRSNDGKSLGCLRVISWRPVGLYPRRICIMY